MARQKLARSISVQEYLDRERDGQVRHEFVGGEAYAMTGASVFHNRIAGNFFAELRSKLGSGGCDVFMADMKVHTAQAFYYPDLMVVCDKGDTDPYTKSRPIVVVEIMSANTRSIDEREKRLAYQGLLSVQEYVLAEQDRAEVRVLRRRNGDWQEEVLGPDDLLRLPTLDVTIAMQAIYEGVWR